jgi:hypothetical protein
MTFLISLLFLEPLDCQWLDWSGQNDFAKTGR